jgi:hypothetical protein
MVQGRYRNRRISHGLKFQDANLDLGRPNPQLPCGLDPCSPYVWWVVYRSEAQLIRKMLSSEVTMVATNCSVEIVAKATREIPWESHA